MAGPLYARARDWPHLRWDEEAIVPLSQEHQGREVSGHAVRGRAAEQRLAARKVCQVALPSGLVALNDRNATVIDVRTGREQPGHTVQLQIYQYALPKALPERFRHARLSGEVVYPSRIARVPRGALPGQFINQLGSTIRRLAAPNPPKPTPSFQECRFCDITVADCSQRIDQSAEADQPTTDDF